MSDVLEVQGQAGRVGPHRESHELRLLAHTFLADGVVPVEGFLEWNGCVGIGEDWGMAFNARLGCCGFSMWQHLNMMIAAANGEDWKNCASTTWLPLFKSLPPAYYAYGIAQGEPGPHPDQGVDNATLWAWAYKLGLIDGYAEVLDNVFDWFAQTFHGGCVGQGLDGTIASNDFNSTPRIPWDTMAQTDGHDTLVGITHTDGSGAMVTWGGVQPYTANYRKTNWQDRWVVFDKEDPKVNWPTLQAALDSVHGVRTPETIRAAWDELLSKLPSDDVLDAPSESLPSPNDGGSVSVPLIASESHLERFEQTVEKDVHDVASFVDEEADKLIRAFPGLDRLIKREVEKSIQVAVPVILSKEFERLAAQLLVGLVA